MRMRDDGRQYNEIRPIKITRNYLKSPEGSVLIEVGDTKVICTATVEERVPPFLKGAAQGWVTAEYAMLPRATGTRTFRESAKGKITGRTQEIQRLIGRSLRSVVDLKKLGERTIYIDCDVIQADGGTRTASITGSFVALIDALRGLKEKHGWEKLPVIDVLAATSVGKVGGQLMVDLCYTEDSSAEVDMNVVMTGNGKFVELQGTAEEYPFTRDEMNKLIELAENSISEIIEIQKQILNLTEDELELI